MSNEQKKHDEQKVGDGYCLLPWGELFREGNMVEWSDAAIAVLPVIAAHANRQGEAYPGYERICALAQVSKSTVAKAIDELVAKGSLEVARRHGKYDQNLYQLLFSYDKDNADDNTRQWIRLDHKLVFRGTWGAMPDSVRRVYLIFRAFAWAGLSALWLGYNGSGYIDPEAHYTQDLGEHVKVLVRGEWEEFRFTEVQFLPEHIYAPALFAELSGVPSRTFRDARAWLLDNGLICPYINACDESITGFIIPFQPGIYFPHVLDAVEKAKEGSSARYKSGPGAKRSMKAMLRRAGLDRTAPPER